MSAEGDRIYKCITTKEGPVHVPEGVKQIAPYAFEDCRRITDISLPEGLEIVCQGAFKGCSGIRTIRSRGMPRCMEESFCLDPGGDGSVCDLYCDEPWNIVDETYGDLTRFVVHDYQ